MAPVVLTPDVVGKEDTVQGECFTIVHVFPSEVGVIDAPLCCRKWQSKKDEELCAKHSWIIC